MKKWALSIGAVFVLSLLTVACGETKVVEVPGETITVTEVVEVPGETITVTEIVEVPGETITVTEIVEVPGETITVTEIVEVPGETITVTEVVEVPGATTVVTETITTVVEVPVQFVKFNESPLLAQRVQGGLLPPVEERLPEEPMVIPVVEEIGRYGGTLRRGHLGYSDRFGWARYNRSGLVRWAYDGTTMIPTLAKGWETSTDGKEWTFFLREGTRWSDGDPFDAADFEYYWNDVILNEDLTPTRPSNFTTGGQLAEFEVVNEHTIKWTFAEPNFVLLEILGKADRTDTTGQHTFAPSHYMKQFHIKYNADADQQAKDAGFENWVQYYNNRFNVYLNPERPSTQAWIATSGNWSGDVTAVRNPYYYAVDPEGNQLPYIDRIEHIFVENSEIVNLKAIAGDFDFQGRHTNLQNFPLFKESEETGDYRTLVWPNVGGNEFILIINPTVEGNDQEALRAVLGNIEFRRALSMAINREEINDALFFSLGQPRNWVPGPDHPMYPGDEYAFKYMYDDEAAVALLDKIVPDVGGDGFRTWNGQPFQIVMTMTTAFTQTVDVGEMMAEDWRAVGINAKVDSVTRSLFSERVAANRAQSWMFYDSALFPFSMYNPFSPGNVSYQGVLYTRWVNSGGAEGLEPPDDLKELIDIIDGGKSLPYEERMELGRKLFRIYTDGMYSIGINGLAPSNQAIFIVKDNLRNVPEVLYNDWTIRTPGNAFPEQFFFKQR